MVANARMTPDETLESMLGGRIEPKPDAKRKTATAASKPKDRQKPAVPQSDQECHKVSIMVPHDVYLAMHLHKTVQGAARGENSLQDIGLNAIRQYVGGYTDVARSLLS